MPRAPTRPRHAWLPWLLAGLLAASAALAQDAGRAPAEGPRFDILEFVVVGDTLLGADAIERAVYPFLGPQRTAADAENARRALEKAYQDAGYLSVTVVLPPQRVDNAGGELRLEVLQAPVERLRITGAQYTLPSLVREALPELAPGNVPDFNEMQRELALLARSSADREVTPIVAAGERPGTMAVEIKLQEMLPLHAFVELNNKQSLNTSAGRLEAGISYDNLFQRGHSLGLNWFYSPRRPTQADIQSLSYHLPLGGTGDRLYLAFTRSDSDTPTALGFASVSRGNTWRARWRDELPARPGISHGLAWGLTVRDLQDAQRDVDGVRQESPALRYTTFNLGYDLTLTGETAERTSGLQADVTISPSGHNRRLVDCGGRVLDQFACKRAASGSAFQVLNLNLSHREPFGRWMLDLRLQAQVTDVPLVPSEQVVYGGVDSVRGYYEGQYAGDLGASLRVELGTPAWSPLDRHSLRGQVFYDRAGLHRLYALPAEQVNANLASAGLGLRVETGYGLQAHLYWAQVLQATGRGARWDLSLRQAF